MLFTLVMIIKLLIEYILIHRLYIKNVNLIGIKKPNYIEMFL